MLGRASSHNCSCASFEQVFSPFQQKPFLSGVSHRDGDYKLAWVFFNRKYIWVILL